MVTRKQLKQEARQELSGNWWTAIKVMIIPYLLLAVVLTIIGIATFATLKANWTAGISEGATMHHSHGTGGSSRASIIANLFLIGVQFTFLDWLRQHQAPLHPVRSGLQVFTGKHFFSVLIIFIVRNIFIFLWSLLLVIPGIIKGYSYSQAFFIYKDIKDRGESDKYSYLDYITLSRKLMDGHKMEFFVLQLSFIGWDLLGMLTLGIGYLWISPYKQMTFVNYYRHLTNEQ